MNATTNKTAIDALTDELILDLRDAISIARHRSDHAGSPVRVRHWDDVLARLNAALAPTVQEAEQEFCTPNGAGTCSCRKFGADPTNCDRLAEVRAERAAIQPAAVQGSVGKASANCGACGARVGERCRTMSDDQCDAGKHVAAFSSGSTARPTNLWRRPARLGTCP